MRIVQTKTEFEWHRKRAKLINLFMRHPSRIQLGRATNTTFEAKVGKAKMLLVRPPLRHTS